MTIAPTIEALERMDEDELRRRYNEIAQHTQVGLVWYQDQLHRRALDRQTRRLERLTWTIAVMTAANVVLVAVSIFT